MAFVHQLVKLGLSPVLLMQGRSVRRTTPRLPEAPGPRDGMSGDGPSLSLLLVGDSAAAGVGAASQSSALSGQLVARLSQHFQVSWTVVARTGHGIQEVLQSVQDRPAERFDVVVTSVGVNDVTGSIDTSEWVKFQSELVDVLSQRLGARQILLSGLPPMHAFPSLPQPLRWYLGYRATRFNAALERFVNKDGRCTYVSAAFPIDAQLMASDGFHPSEAAYALWSDRLASVICQRFFVGADG